MQLSRGINRVQPLAVLVLSWMLVVNFTAVAFYPSTQRYSTLNKKSSQCWGKRFQAGEEVKKYFQEINSNTGSTETPRLTNNGMVMDSATFNSTANTVTYLNRDRRFWKMGEDERAYYAKINAYKKTLAFSLNEENVDKKNEEVTNNFSILQEVQNFQ